MGVFHQAPFKTSMFLIHCQSCVSVKGTSHLRSSSTHTQQNKTTTTTTTANINNNNTRVCNFSHYLSVALFFPPLANFTNNSNKTKQQSKNKTNKRTNNKQTNKTNQPTNQPTKNQRNKQIPTRPPIIMSLQINWGKPQQITPFLVDLYFF